MAYKTAVVKTKYGSFSCIFKPEKDMGGYIVIARDAQGAVSWGKNFTEAKRMITEAIEGIVEIDVLARAEKEGLIKVKHRKIPVGIV